MNGLFNVFLGFRQSVCKSKNYLHVVCIRVNEDEKEEEDVHC